MTDSIRIELPGGCWFQSSPADAWRLVAPDGSTIFTREEVDAFISAIAPPPPAAGAEGQGARIACEVPEGLNPIAFASAKHAHQKALEDCTDIVCPDDHLDAAIRGYLAAVPQPCATDGQPVTLPYTNHEGRHAERTITPTGRMLFTSNQWHPKPQWLVEAHDHVSGTVRLFALSGFGAPAGRAGVDAGDISPDDPRVTNALRAFYFDDDRKWREPYRTKQGENEERHRMAMAIRALKLDTKTTPGPAEATLPCDVWLPPVTRIAKGCALSTLTKALEQRAKGDGWAHEMSEASLVKMASEIETTPGSVEAELPAEGRARDIYNSWKDQPGWKPWVTLGNSDKQWEARMQARREVAGASRPTPTQAPQQDGEERECKAPGGICPYLRRCNTNRYGCRTPGPQQDGEQAEGGV